MFTRIRNNDDIYAGLSSFEVEMKEFNVILKYANENSIILGDELCSGTETLEYRKNWTGDKLEMIMADLPAKEEEMVNIAKAAEEAVIDHNEELTENE